MMIRFLRGVLVTFIAFSSVWAETRTMVIAIGAAGESEYGREFSEWAERWEKAAANAGMEVTVVGHAPVERAADRELLEKAIASEAQRDAGELWLVLIGHGTYDGRTARFNLRGPDVTVEDLKSWLSRVHRPLAVIDATSASAPFIPMLSGKGRVIITATKTGAEVNFARFGDYFSTAVANPNADLDKDGQTSLLDAFLVASRQTSEFYATERRVQTEHALIDDNGDGLGTPEDVTSAKKSARPIDGGLAREFVLLRNGALQRLSAELREKRDGIEAEIIELRSRKSEIPEPQYYQRLEKLLLDLAWLYEKASGRR
jgi:hypothetical protein